MTKPRLLMALVIVTVAMTNGCILNCAFRRAPCEGPSCGAAAAGMAPCREERVGLSKHLHNTLTCQSGCGGDLYFNDWTSAPPDACDPCDGCGNWVGRGCGGRSAAARLGIPPFIARNFGMIWGRRFEGCGRPSCPDCGGHGEVIEPALEIEPEPTVAEDSVLQASFQVTETKNTDLADTTSVSLRRGSRKLRTGRIH